MDGWMGGWMDGWIDGWMDGWMDANLSNWPQSPVCFHCGPNPFLYITPSFFISFTFKFWQTIANMIERMDRCIHGQDGWMDGWMDEWMDGCIHGQDGCIHRWMDGWMNGWMHSWIGWIEGSYAT